MTVSYSGTWAAFNVQIITNIFLYGQATTPTNYADRLRTAEQYDDAPLVVRLDAVSFMATGPGRFAHASDVSFVQNFYSGQSITLPPKTYTRSELIAEHGFEMLDFVAVYDQSLLDTGSSDYAQRTYIYGRNSFAISDDTQFIVHADGSREIQNLGLLPVDDNFDFDSSNPITQYGNDTILEPNIDPYGIGRTVNIEFSNKDSVTRVDNYGYSDYLQDKIDAANQPKTDVVSGGIAALSAMYDVIDLLQSSGTVEYETSTGNKIIYGYSSGSSQDIFGTENSDIIIAGSRAFLSGHDGDDTIWGSSFNDRIFGGVGNDTIYGGDGNDSINGGIGGGGPDEDFDGEADDTIYGGAGDDFIQSDGGNDYIEGGAGDDDINLESWGNSTVYGNDGNDSITVHLISENTTINIDGGTGSDNFSLTDMKGTANIDGGAGNDYYYTGGYAGNNYTLNAYDTDGNDTYVLFRQIANIEDIQGDDVYYLSGGSGGSTSINDLAGSDKIKVGAKIGNDGVGAYFSLSYANRLGDDLVLGLNSRSSSVPLGTVHSLTLVNHYAGQKIEKIGFSNTGFIDLDAYLNSTVLSGTSANNTITGNSGNNIIFGAGGNDIINGGGGNDTLIGSTGDDVLTGGSGSDTFAFQYLTDMTANTDHITDLTSEDFVDLSNINGLTFIGTDAFTGTIGQMRYGYDNGNTVIEIDSTGDGIRDHRIVIDNGEFRLVETASGSQILTAIQNAAPEAKDDFFIIAYNENATGNVLSDNGYGVDEDPDGDIITVIAASFLTVNNGNVVLLSDGSFTYSAASGFLGYDFFEYEIEDSNGLTGTAMVTIEVIPPSNNAPTAKDDNFTVTHGTYETIITGNVLSDNGNGVDIDIDGDALSIVETSIVSAQGFSISISPNGDFTYTASAGYIGTDTFSYTLSDDEDETDTATVSITISAPSGYTLGTSSSDTYTGTSSADKYIGMVGNDIINGNNGNDELYGSAGDDIIQGGAGDDLLVGGDGIDTLTYSAATSAVVVSLAILSAQNTGSAGIDIISGFENLTGSNHNDTLTGNNDNNVIDGGAGNNYLYGGLGIDVLIGGSSIDRIYVDDGGGDFLSGGSGGDYYRFSNLSAVADAIIEDNGGLAGTANDYIQIYGASVAPTVTYRLGSNGVDLMVEITGYGSITIKNQFAVDTSDKIESLEFILNGGGSTSSSLTGVPITGTENADTLTYLSGMGAIYGLGGDDVLTGNNSANTLYGDDGNDTLSGLDGNDTLYGGSGNDTIDGGSGDNDLHGGTGVDIITGGSGRDRIYVDDAGGDFMSGGTGDDYYRFTNLNAVAGAMIEDNGGLAGTANDYIQIYGATVAPTVVYQLGSNGVDLIVNIGSYGSITIKNQFAANTSDRIEQLEFILNGGGTTSVNLTVVTLTGTENADIITAPIAGTINGLGGDDVLYGNSGVNILNGGDGIDTINGLGGNDIVHGDDGNDILIASDGVDTLYGDAGSDTFLFNVINTNSDTIADFSLAQSDKIEIANLLQGYDLLTDAITDFVQITTSGSNSLLKIDVDGGGNGFVQIATISGVTGLIDEAALVTSGSLVIS